MDVIKKSIYYGLGSFVSSLLSSNATRGVKKIKRYSSMLIASQKVSTQRVFPCLAASATQTALTTELDVESKLLTAIQDTGRGLVTTDDQRSSINTLLFLVTVEPQRSSMDA